MCQKEIDYKAKNKTRLSHSFSIIGERDNIKAYHVNHKYSTQDFFLIINNITGIRTMAVNGKNQDKLRKNTDCVVEIRERYDSDRNSVIIDPIIYTVKEWNDYIKTLEVI